MGYRVEKMGEGRRRGRRTRTRTRTRTRLKIKKKSREGKRDYTNSITLLLSLVSQKWIRRMK